MSVLDRPGLRRGTRDIGVALGVPEPYTSQLQGWRERLGDPGAGSIPPHITLVPPTPVTPAALAAAEEHLRAVTARHDGFTVRLRGTGSFRPVSPVVFVVVERGAHECARLAGAVRSGPLDCAVTFPYHPHVTVAHDLDAPALDAAEVALHDYEAVFRVWGVTLFERGADGVWRPQRDFPFGASPVGPVPPPGAGGPPAGAR